MAEALPRERMSREEYYRWAMEQPRGRFERVDGIVVAMAPETGAHVRVKAAVWLALRDAVAAAGLDCEAMPDGMAVETGESDYQPDASVHCGPRIPDEATAVPNPVVVVEVLSRSTRGVDTGAKLAGYFLVPSIQHYLIVDPKKRMIVHHRRRADGEGLHTRLVSAGSIDLSPPGIVLSVDAVYAV